MNDGVKLTCAKNGSVMKLVLTSRDKTALVRRYWSLYNNNATGSSSLNWINKNDDSSPYCASVWTNPKRLKKGLRNALDLKYGKADYESKEEEELINKKIDTELEIWIDSIGKEQYMKFTADTYERHTPKSKMCTLEKILANEYGNADS